MVNSSDLVGKILGAYTLEKLIGRGGMSAVYLARQARLSRYVAIKVLLPNITIGSRVHNEFLLRFQHEARVIANLEHINIIPIYEYNEQDKHAYLVMPYLAGGNLGDLLVQYSALSPAKASQFIDQAAAALDYAHAHGVIHRDLKPSNFLLHSDGRLVLADFGIARMMQGRSSPTLTLTGTILGTPEYMAPEMALGQPIDARTDIYELGIVLFYLLSGHVPFKGSSIYETIEQHLQTPLPSLHQLNSTIPPAVDAVVQKAAAKRPEDRFASAGEMAQAMQLALTSLDPRFAPTLISAHSVPSSPVADPITAIAESSKLFLHAAPPIVPTLPHVVPGRKKRHHLQFGGIFLLFLVLLIVGAFIGFPLLVTNSVGTTKIPHPLITIHNPAQEAEALVRQFYNNLNNRDYQSAFSLLVTNRTLCSFANDYSHTLRQDISFGKVTPLPNDEMQVPFTINATENIDAGTVKRVYQTYQNVRKVDNTLKIVGEGSLHQIGSTEIITPWSSPSPAPGASVSQQAQYVIQQYHDDLSHQSYRYAYNLWGSAYQNTTTFCQFLLDHVKILRDAITFNNIMPLADGTIQASVAIQETSKISSRQQQETYHESYFVGQENNSWKILKGTAA